LALCKLNANSHRKDRSNTATSALEARFTHVQAQPVTIFCCDVTRLGDQSSASPTADLNLGIFASVDGGATTTLPKLR